MKKVTVLNVDDNEAGRFVVTQQLRRAGFEVWEAGTGSSALDQASRLPDIVLLDVNLPDMNGFDVCRQLRTDPLTRNLTILQMSASSVDEAHKVAGLENGADGYLTEPVGAAELVATVRAFSRVRAAEAAARFLAHSSTTLAETLGEPDALSRIARVAVPFLADCCFVVELTDDLRVARTALAHVDPSREAALAEFLQAAAADEGRAVEQLWRGGAAVLYPEPGDAGWAGEPLGEQHPTVLQRMDARSYLRVPIFARGRPLGAMTLATSDPNRRFGSDDLAHAQELARSAGVTIDNGRLLDAAQAARAEAERLNRLKDEFLATVSHELRTPLHAVLGWSRLLRSGELSPEKAKRAVEVIERNALAQQQLIDDLLDVSRIIAGKLRLEIGSLELAAVVEAALDGVRQAAVAKGVDLTVAVGSVETTMMGDADRLQQVVWNLVLNAVKFTPKGGRVRVDLRMHDSFAELTVADTGKGISPEFLPNVFNRFEQQDAGHARAQGGLGLGLAIVRHLVDMHGGTIRAESEGAGKGATFIVRLPLAAEHAAPPESLAPAQQIPPRSVPAPTTLAGIRVLIVEDDHDGRELLVELLRRAGADVLEAASAAAALDMCQRETFEVLVSDIGLPGRDGYALMADIQSMGDKRAARIPAIALTAYAREQDKTDALRAGFDVHLTKRVAAGALLAAVKELGSRQAGS